MPTLTFSYEDCQQMAAAIDSMVSQLQGTAESAEAAAASQKYTKIRETLNNAVNVGTLDPAIVLRVLNEVSNRSTTGPVVFHRPERSAEETEHAVRLRACGMLEGQRDQQGVRVSRVNEKGEMLRDFLLCWGNPAVPLDVPRRRGKNLAV
jgi:hypothetical protein